MWLRREPDKSITAVVYVGYGDGARYQGIWTLSCKPGAPILRSIIDKPHRVAWVLDEPDDPWFGACLMGWRSVPGGPVRRRPKTRGRKSSRRVHSPVWLLPRKFRENDRG
jgi:hypothetical protein